jgi:hypothetical protein
VGELLVEVALVEVALVEVALVEVALVEVALVEVALVEGHPAGQQAGWLLVHQSNVGRRCDGNRLLEGLVAVTVLVVSGRRRLLSQRLAIPRVGIEVGKASRTGHSAKKKRQGAAAAAAGLDGSLAAQAVAAATAAATTPEGGNSATQPAEWESYRAERSIEGDAEATSAGGTTTSHETDGGSKAEAPPPTPTPHARARVWLGKRKNGERRDVNSGHITA